MHLERDFMCKNLGAIWGSWMDTVRSISFSNFSGHLLHPSHLKLTPVVYDRGDWVAVGMQHFSHYFILVQAIRFGLAKWKCFFLIDSEDFLGQWAHDRARLCLVGDV